MRLLLVEDDHMLGASLKRALENHAYGVDWGWHLCGNPVANRINILVHYFHVVWNHRLP